MLQHTTVSEAQDIFLKSVMNLATMDTTTKDIKQRLSARAPSVGYACALLLHNGVNRLIQLHTPYGFRAMLSLLHTYVACSSYRYGIKQYLYLPIRKDYLLTGALWAAPAPPYSAAKGILSNRRCKNTMFEASMGLRSIFFFKRTRRFVVFFFERRRSVVPSLCIFGMLINKFVDCLFWCQDYVVSWDCLFVLRGESGVLYELFGFSAVVKGWVDHREDWSSVIYLVPL